jgi:RNA polymerase sigma factor (sigma-70 family)
LRVSLTGGFAEAGRAALPLKESSKSCTLSYVDARAQAIEELYRERFAGYCNAIATVTGSYDTARDVVQEAFARALRKRRSLRQSESLAPWVWTIALRLARDSRPGDRSAEGQFGEPMLFGPERDSELAAAIHSLSPRRRLIVFMRYFADFSYAEIAEACQVSEGTVAATLAQAHEALRTALTSEETEGARR